MRTLCLALMVVAAVMLLAAPAAAEPSFRVQFTPGSECADARAAEAELRARSLAVVAEGATQELLLTVTRQGAIYDAHMVINEAGQPPLRRDVTAGTCTDVLRTFAFTLALASDAMTRPGAQPARPPRDRGVGREQESAPPPPAAPPQEGSHVELAAHASTGVVAGAAPIALLVLGGDAELAYVREGRIFSPLFRLGGFAAVPATTQQPFINTRYGLQAGRLEACPVVFLELLRPCARVEVGRLQMKEFGAPGATLQDELWATAQLAAMLRWSPFSPLFFEASGAVGLALSRPTLSYVGQDLYTVPLVNGGAEIAVGVRFP